MFYAPGDFPDLKVSPGKQAVVVKVSQTTAVLSQKMKPEQHVDVLLTVDNLGSGDVTRLQSTGGSVGGDSIGSTSSAMTATLFKGVKILAINRGYTTAALQGGEAQNVTLELDEDQTRIISLAQRKGEIDLVYNEGGDEGNGIEINPSEKDRITLKEILGLKDPPNKEKPFKTEHYRGGGHSRTYFEDGEMIDGNGKGAGGNTDGSRLQSTGGSVGGWSTDMAPADQQKNLARKAGVSADL